MARIVLYLLLAGAVVAGLGYLFLGQPDPTPVTFARATRQTLVSTIITNGRIEPIEFSSVRAARDGVLRRLPIRKGDMVRSGQMIAEFSMPEGASELAAAQARVAQVKADLAVFDKGGPNTALTEIDNGLAAIKLDLELAQREAEKTRRLVDKQAETREALVQAEDRIRQLQAQRESLERRRSALLPAGGREAAEARLRDAEAAVSLAQTRSSESVVRAPMAGTIYNLAVLPGAFVRAGDLIAEIGRVEKVRMLVYVDEPELGRVAKGMPVRITWDATGARQWEATVERLPTQIVTMGSRQVGEVLCSLANDDKALPPGANINAEIRSAAAGNAIAIPKAALRRQGNATGVLVLVNQAGKATVEWRPVQTGISSVTHAEVTSGLKEGDAVALPTETPVKPGEPVLPTLP